METSNGGYYSPIHPARDCYTLLYIPETRPLMNKPPHLYPENIIDKCSGRPLSDYYPVELRGKPIHRDPRLDLGFYTGYYMGPPGHGRLPKNPDKGLGRGDLLLFMAGLATYPEEPWGKGFTLPMVKRVLRKTCRMGGCGVYIVGGIIVEHIVDTSVAGWNRAISEHPVLEQSPHYYRISGDGRDHPVAVVGRGFQLDRPLLIGRGKNNPHRNLAELIGEGNAVMVSRNNYRRSRIIVVESIEDFMDKLLKLSEA